MKTIELTRGLKTKVDDEDYDYLMQHSWFAQKDNRGKIYAATTIMGDTVYMHRLLMDEKDGDVVIDHKNNNTLDNRKENLVASSSQENAMNKSKTEENRSSKFKGVTKMPNGKWKAHIGKNDKDIHLGYFDTENEAAEAYNNEAKKLFGEKAKLNET
jgi:hypothetical protein